MSALASSNSDGGDNTEKWSAQSFRGGVELGLWKGLGSFRQVSEHPVIMSTSLMF
jgi:hypothetical protein